MTLLSNPVTSRPAGLTHCGRGRARGFTLIELLVSIGLMSIMLTMMAMIFSRAQSAFKQTRTAVEIHQTARSILDTMRQDFAAVRMVKYWPTGASDELHAPAAGRLVGIDSTQFSTLSMDESVYGDVIEFTTAADQSGAKSGNEEIETGRVSIVRYFLVDDGNGTRDLRKLVHVVDDDDDLTANLAYVASTSANEGEPLGFNVVSMHFHYYGPALDEGRSVWTEDDASTTNPQDIEGGDWPPASRPAPPRLPPCVQVTLEIADHHRTTMGTSGDLRTYTFTERFYLSGWNSE